MAQSRTLLVPCSESDDTGPGACGEELSLSRLAPDGPRGLPTKVWPELRWRSPEASEPSGDTGRGSRGKIIFGSVGMPASG